MQMHLHGNARKKRGNANAHTNCKSTRTLHTQLHTCKCTHKCKHNAHAHTMHKTKLQHKCTHTNAHAETQMHDKHGEKILTMRIYVVSLSWRRAHFEGLRGKLKAPSWLVMNDARLRQCPSSRMLSKQLH
jgi:hypothetical protein